MSRKSAPFRQCGMTLVELLVVIAILAGLVLLVAPTAGKIIRRSQLVAAHSTLKQALATARLQAVKRGSNVVVLMSLSPENKLRLVTFQDRANDETNPLPADEEAAAGNFVRNTGFIAGFIKQPADKVTPDKEIAALVRESFVLIQMVVELQETLGVRLMQEDLAPVKTVGQLIEAVRRKKGG